MSVFEHYHDRAWPYRYRGALHVGTIAGGTPTNEKVMEGYLKTKLASPDEIIREAVAEVMVERGVTVEEATKLVGNSKSLNGFKRDSHGLYIEGRQLKACIKEGASVAGAADKIPMGTVWGKTRKGLLSFIAEHVMVVDDRIHLGTEEPTGIMQRFVHTFRGASIQYEEYVEDADLEFTVIADYEFTEEHWAMIWLTAEQQGLGASRSQGFGRFTVTEWELIS
jgi:hypothetical protein